MRTANPDSPSKKKILAAARELMLTKGYNDTSVDEICKKSGVAKGSFFHYFEDKQAVAAEALQCFVRDQGEAMACSCEGEADPLKRIFATIDMAIRKSRSSDFKGCLMGMLLQETSRTQPKLRESCCESLQSAYAFFEKDLKAAKEKYAPHDAKVNPKELAQYYMSVVQGSFLLAKADGNAKLIESNLKLLKEHIRGAFGL